MKFLVAMDEEQATVLAWACETLLDAGRAAIPPPDEKVMQVLSSVKQVIEMGMAGSSGGPNVARARRWDEEEK